MRLLQLCPRLPFPLTDGGRIGIFNITKHLALRGHTIDMIAFADPDSTDDDVRGLEAFCSVTMIRDDTRTNLRNFLRSVVRHEPVYISRHRSDAFRAALHAALAAHTYDAVFGDHTAMFPYLLEAKEIAHIPVVVRLHNVESVIWHRYARSEHNPLKKLIAYRQAQMLERFEARNAELVDANFTITAVDEARMARLAPRARVVTVPPGVDTEYWAPVERDPASTIAITATTFSWIHNVNGVIWFLDQVLPLVREHVPGFAMHLLGRCPPADLQKRAGAEVVVHGFVDDVRPYAARAGVYVVPLHVGSGIRIKILEAMAMGMPVVTTSVGCEGIPGVPGTHFLIADTAEEFAAAVTAMLTQPERAAAIGRAARAFVVDHFSWDVTAALIETEIATQISRRTPSRQETRHA